MDAKAQAEARRRSLLADVERALLEAISDSREVQACLRRLHRAGWLLELQLGCRRDVPGEGDPIPAPPSRRATPARRPAAARAAGGEAPAFRMDAEDLRFLRSIGIDPTRKRPAQRPA